MRCESIVKSAQAVKQILTVHTQDLRKLREVEA